MLKIPHSQVPRSWFYLLLLGLLLLVTACDLGTNSTNSAATPTSSVGSPVIGSGNSSPTASPTLTGSTPTATPSHTPTAAPRPTATPTPRPTATPTPKPGTNPTVTITTDSNGAFLFSPKTLTITHGTTVIWKNQTQVSHTIIGNSFGGGFVTPGGTLSFKFTSAGTFAYHCGIHPYMTGTIIVT
jgi:plastocyanin